jgi:Double zinc ribbon
MPDDFSMLRTECTFCDHANPPQSKYCNACGAPLHLTLCPNCDALNDKTATTCYKCETVLPSSQVEALSLSSAAQTDEYFRGAQTPLGIDSPAPAASEQWDGNLAGSSAMPPARPPLIKRAFNAVSSKRNSAFVGSRWASSVSNTSPGKRSGVLVGGVSVLALLGAALYGYFGSTTEVPKYPAAVAESSRSTAGVATKGATPPVDAARNQEDAAHEREGAEIIPSQSNAAAVPVQNQNANAGGAQQTRASESCSQVVAALGLCSPQSAQGR